MSHCALVKGGFTPTDVETCIRWHPACMRWHPGKLVCYESAWKSLTAVKRMLSVSVLKLKYLRIAE